MKRGMWRTFISRRQALTSLSVAGTASAAAAASAGCSPSDRPIGKEGRLDVTAFMTPAMLDDVRAGTLSVDCSAAFQAAIDAASARDRSTLTAGQRLYVPGGRYLIRRALKYVWRDEQRVADDGDMRRLTVEGDGSANVVLFYAGPATGPAFEVRAHKAARGDAPSLRLAISGLRLRRSQDFHRTGTGLKLDGVEGIILNDVEISGFDTNLDATDTLRFDADSVHILGGNIGISARGQSFSSPNVYTFNACNLSGNGDTAARFEGGCNIAFRSCCFEGNGSAGDKGAAILFRDGPAQGGAATHIDTCYFENNLVSAEVLFDWTTADGGTVKLTACTFQRTDIGRASPHIAFRSLKGSLLAHIDSCAFKSFGAYRPSSSRPAIVASGNQSDLTFTACYFQNSVEAPPLRNGSGRLIAGGGWEA